MPKLQDKSYGQKRKKYAKHSPRSAFFKCLDSDAYQSAYDRKHPAQKQQKEQEKKISDISIPFSIPLKSSLHEDTSLI